MILRPSSEMDTTMTQQNDGGAQEGGSVPSPEPLAGTSQQQTLEQVQAERDKWKALSRTNEERWKASSTELQQLKDAQMTDQEKAVEAARLEGRTAALDEMAQELVNAELRLLASAAGATLPDMQFLNVAQFQDASGKPDVDKVKTFVESLAKQKPGMDFPHLAGAGHNRGGASGIESMDPNELADIISGGSII